MDLKYNCMVTTIKKYIFVATILSMNLAYSNILPEICEEFEKYPETFKPLKIDEKSNSFTFDIEKNGKRVKCEAHDDGGSCHNSIFSCNSNSGYLNSKSDGYSFGILETPVEFKTKLYFFLSRYTNGIKNTDSITDFTKDGKTILCDVVQEITEVTLLKDNHPVCKAVVNNKVARLNLIDSKIKKDLKRDGSDISYSNDGYESGAGCGDSLKAYKAESSVASNKSFVEAFNSLNSNDSGTSGLSHPLDWEVIRFEKKDYLFLHTNGLKKGSQIGYGLKIQPEVVYEWNGKGWTTVCESTFKTQAKAIKPVL